jgi:hypothetical protein
LLRDIAGNVPASSFGKLAKHYKKFSLDTQTESVVKKVINRFKKLIIGLKYYEKAEG